MSIDIHFLSYEGARNGERHGHAQLVLPVRGTLDIDIGGTAGRLDPGRAAFVPPGVAHSQLAEGDNRFIVLNADMRDCGEAAETLAERLFLPLSEAARHLVGFAVSVGENTRADLVRCWTPLLFDALTSAPACPASRLARLAAEVEARLDAPWTVRDMAERAGLSPSRLHALFQSQWGTSPRAWLAERRMRRAEAWLRENRPIAEVAQRAGYADQSALTRAMRRLTGETPGAVRRKGSPGQKNGSPGQDKTAAPC